jgi:hypothetical protein
MATKDGKKAACPMCGADMEDGVLVITQYTSSFGMYWCKEHGLYSTKDKISLPGGQERTAQICRKCQYLGFKC